MLRNISVFGMVKKNTAREAEPAGGREAPKRKTDETDKNDETNETGKGEKDMYIIVGLGNPGREYEHTRHNIGFDVIDMLAEEYRISVTEKKHKALIGKGMIDGVKAVLAKPQTYMNLSGESVRALLDYYKTDEREELLVIYDDISLDVGRLRIRKKGSAGGHNGIKSILAHVGHDEFARIKVGVGDKPKGRDLVNHVLGGFSAEDREIIKESIKRASQAAVCIMSEGADRAMNLYNGG